MKILGFSGPSDSGKTWMIERLVNLWSEVGIRVGVVKHCSKGYSLDQEGKDSARCWEAGAEAVAVVGPGEWAVRHREPLADPIRIARAAFPRGLDVAILEGFREVSAPRVRVLGKNESASSVPADPHLLAIVSREPTRVAPAPIFALTDAQGLSAFLLGRLLFAPGTGSPRGGAQGQEHPVGARIQA